MPGDTFMVDFVPAGNGIIFHHNGCALEQKGQASGSGGLQRSFSAEAVTVPTPELARRRKRWLPWCRPGHPLQQRRDNTLEADKFILSSLAL